MSERYKIWQLGRYGNIIYYSLETKETFEVTVEEIIKNQTLMDEFPEPDRKYLMSLRTLYKASYYDEDKKA